MIRRNDKNFTTFTQVAKWYNAKFKEMGGSWKVPDEEIDSMLDKLGATSAQFIEGACGYHSVSDFLDLGCGDGKVMRRAFLRGFNAYGNDISSEAIGLVAESMTQSVADYYLAFRSSLGEDFTIPLWNVYQWPMENLDEFLDTESFDFIFSYGSLEHALDINRALVSVRNLLKPDGKALIYAPNEKWEHFDQPLETTATCSEWEAMVTDAGLRLEYSEEIGNNTIYIVSRG